jgi:cephalosporin hydroxylase
MKILSIIRSVLSAFFGVQTNSKFKSDPYFENKALITSAPYGFLKKIK